MELYPYIYPKISKSRRIQIDYLAPSTSSAPQPTKLQDFDDLAKKHDYALRDAEKRQHINHEAIVDASATVHEVDRIVNSF